MCVKGNLLVGSNYIIIGNLPLKNIYSMSYPYAKSYSIKKYFYVFFINANRYKNRHLSTKLLGPNNQEVHQCDQCNNTCETFQQLTEHRSKSHPRSLRAAEIAKRNHGQRSFLCEICGKAYTQSSHLWQHLRFHQGSVYLVYFNSFIT